MENNIEKEKYILYTTYQLKYARFRKEQKKVDALRKEMLEAYQAYCNFCEQHDLFDNVNDK